MKVGKKLVRIGAAAAVAFVALAAPALGGGQSLAMLDQLDSGRWEVRLREPGNPVQKICVDNGRRLIQLRHPADSCERFVVQDGASDVTVQYTCRGRGYGRTHIRRETSRLVQISSQGIAQGLPFDFTAEARRVGECGA
ncbi:MAG: hypothetical protein ABL926_10680 [Novosphingobium sp.]|uniref:DUF3617 domain-containing protein n=1 Tax=Novosphingobium sp. TaxID=1874826 RepID=UPI0032B77D64